MKPIHKFNGGRGATLCNECSKIIIEGMTDDLFCEEHGGRRKFKYTLIREHDGLTYGSDKIKWVEWNENGTSKALHDEPLIGRSLILNPSIMYTWLTTTVTEIVEQRDGYVKFKTLNSIYELNYERD